MDIFPEKFPTADQGAKLSQTERVFKNTYGDGYVERGEYGINTRARKLSLSWSTLSSVEARELQAWLFARKNLHPFLFTHYLDTQRVYVCTECDLDDTTGEYAKVTATFEEDFTII